MLNITEAKTSEKEVTKMTNLLRKTLFGLAGSVAIVAGLYSVQQSLSPSYAVGVVNNHQNVHMTEQTRNEANYATLTIKDMQDGEQLNARFIDDKLVGTQWWGTDGADGSLRLLPEKHLDSTRRHLKYSALHPVESEYYGFPENADTYRNNVGEVRSFHDQDGDGTYDVLRGINSSPHSGFTQRRSEDSAAFDSTVANLLQYRTQ